MDEERLLAIEHALRDRHPWLKVRATRMTMCNGDIVQDVQWFGPVFLLERYGLATREFLMSRRDARSRAVLDDGGARIYGALVSNDHEDVDSAAAYVGFQTIIEKVAGETPLPKYAINAADRILRRLLRRLL